MPHSLYQLPIEVAKVAVEHVGRAMTNRPVIVPQYVFNMREAKCRQNLCGFFNSEQLRCMSCRCWLNTPRVGKWRLAGAACPEGLWGPFNS
jgi:hypothetical protein